MSTLRSLWHSLTPFVVVELEPVTITFKGVSENSGKFAFTDADGEDLELDASWFGTAGPFFRGTLSFCCTMSVFFVDGAS